MAERRSEVLIPEYIIKFWIAQLAQQIAKNYHDSLAKVRALSQASDGEEKLHKDGDLVIATVLTGGVIFAGELLQELHRIGINARFESLKASSYGQETVS